MEWLEILISILTGLAAVIPVAAKLVATVKTATQEQNWSALLRMGITYMQEAENKFATGAEKKEWVISMLEKSAVSANYPLTDEHRKQIEEMIDAIADASHLINTEVAS